MKSRLSESIIMDLKENKETKTSRKRIFEASNSDVSLDFYDDVLKISESTNEYLSYIETAGNECAFTDRMVEQVLRDAKVLKEHYEDRFGVFNESADINKLKESAEDSDKTFNMNFLDELNFFIDEYYAENPEDYSGLTPLEELTDEDKRQIAFYIMDDEDMNSNISETVRYYLTHYTRETHQKYQQQ